MVLAICCCYILLERANWNTSLSCVLNQRCRGDLHDHGQEVQETFDIDYMFDHLIFGLVYLEIFYCCWFFFTTSTFIYMISYGVMIHSLNSYALDYSWCSALSHFQKPIHTYCYVEGSHCCLVPWGWWTVKDCWLSWVLMP